MNLINKHTTYLWQTLIYKSIICRIISLDITLLSKHFCHHENFRISKIVAISFDFTKCKVFFYVYMLTLRNHMLCQSPSVLFFLLSLTTCDVLFSRSHVFSSRCLTLLKLNTNISNGYVDKHLAKINRYISSVFIQSIIW